MKKQILKIVIPGEPIPKKRPRFGFGGRVYDIQSSEKLKVKKMMSEQMEKLFACDDREIVIEASRMAQDHPFDVRMVFHMSIPKSCSEGQKNAKLWGFEKPTVKPDYDNLEKFYLDCGSGILWADDKQIVSGSALKMYSVNPRTEIMISSKKEPFMDPKVKGILKIFSPEKLKDLIESCKEMSEICVITGLEDELLVNYSTVLAYALSAFSQVFSEDLKKIRKYDVSSEEISQFKSVLEEIC